jgi:hypothetical protein
MGQSTSTLEKQLRGQTKKLIKRNTVIPARTSTQKPATFSLPQAAMPIQRGAQKKLIML